MIKNKLIVVALLFILIACNKEIQLDGFDAEGWKKDLAGCQNFRKTMIHNVKLQKEKLLGLRENQIVKLLGPPDQKDLRKRGQKVFIYFIDSKNTKCDSTFKGIPASLKIRFSALELSNELIFAE